MPPSSLLDPVRAIPSRTDLWLIVTGLGHAFRWQPSEIKALPLREACFYYREALKLNAPTP